MALQVRQNVLWDVEEEVRKLALLDEGPHAISVRRLAERGIAQEPEIAAALLALGERGWVTTVAVIRCPNGDEVWRGVPEEVHANLYRRCMECDTREENSIEDVRFRFYVSEDWSARFAAEKKKTVMPAHPQHL